MKVEDYTAATDIAIGLTEGCIVEIGVYKGYGTSLLTQSKRPVYGIDPWGLDGNNYATQKGWPEHFTGEWMQDWSHRPWELREEAELAAPKATLITGFSVDVAATWQLPVGFLLIDGDHNLEGVLADFYAWRPHLLPDAQIMFDDNVDDWPGVQGAIEALLTSGEIVDAVQIADAVLVRLP